MSEGRHRSHKDEVVASLRDKRVIQQFLDAQALLKRHLVHTRQILNGKDFLFLGPKNELHDALKLIVNVVHEYSRFIRIDFVQVDEYFLLRIVGFEADQQLVSGYFE
jgi:hypothetical protein